MTPILQRFLPILSPVRKGLLRARAEAAWWERGTAAAGGKACCCGRTSLQKKPADLSRVPGGIRRRCHSAPFRHKNSRDSTVNSSTRALLLKRTCQALTGFCWLLSLTHFYHLCLPFQHQSSFSLSCCPFANVPWPHPMGLPSHPCSSPFSDTGRWKGVRPLPPASSPLTPWRQCFQHTLSLSRPPSHR